MKLIKFNHFGPIISPEELRDSVSIKVIQEVNKHISDSDSFLFSPTDPNYLFAK